MRARARSLRTKWAWSMSREHDVVGVATPAGEQAGVFLAEDGLPDEATGGRGRWTTSVMGVGLSCARGAPNLTSAPVRVPATRARSRPVRAGGRNEGGSGITRS